MAKKESKYRLIAHHSSNVLSGRGNGTNKHSGNIAYRKLLSAYSAAYVSPSANAFTKKNIIFDIADTIRKRGGLFLECNKYGEWVPMNTKKITTKISQGLRDQIMNTEKTQKRDTETIIGQSINAKEEYFSKQQKPATHQMIESISSLNEGMNINTMVESIDRSTAPCIVDESKSRAQLNNPNSNLDEEHIFVNDIEISSNDAKILFETIIPDISDGKDRNKKPKTNTHSNMHIDKRIDRLSKISARSRKSTLTVFNMITNKKERLDGKNTCTTFESIQKETRFTMNKVADFFEPLDFYTKPHVEEKISKRSRSYKDSHKFNQYEERSDSTILSFSTISTLYGGVNNNGVEPNCALEATRAFTESPPSLISFKFSHKTDKTLDIRRSNEYNIEKDLYS